MLRPFTGRFGLRALAVVGTAAVASTLAVGTASATATIKCTDTTQPNVLCRYYGADRMETAIASYQDLFADGSAGAVVLSRSDLYADALAGTPLAAVKNAELLLTPPNALDSRTLTEMQRVLPKGKTVYLLGSAGALSTAVETSVKNAGYAVKRVYGADRFATSVAIANEIGNVDTVTLATGMNFPDALGAGNAMAAYSGTNPTTNAISNGAVLLTNDTKLPASVSTYLSAHSSAAVLTAGLQAATAAQNAGITTAGDFVGKDRYDTAAQIADAFFGDPTDATKGPQYAGLVDGLNFPDALAGGLVSAYVGGPLLLTDPNTLSSYTSTFLTHYAPSVKEVDVFGGPTVVTDAVANAALKAVS